MSEISLDLRDRRASFRGLEDRVFDLLVIGAGITGAGVARDAALRGLSVALVEANDFGSGTSSRSSKLIHGGLRYLAQGEVAVVREAATERRVLRRIAPHLTLTNPMVMPARSKAGITSMRAAMWTFEKLAKVDKPERHEVWDKKRLQNEEPTIKADGLAGAVVYPEYVTDDGRLVLANAVSAVQAGARVATYAPVTEIILENGRVSGAVVQSSLPGDENGARIRARLTVNAAGPWVDHLRHLEDDQARNKLQLTKGIHLVFNHDRLPISRTVIMRASDRRGAFIVPHGRFVYTGTTDTFYPEPEYWPEITREDVDYLLESVNRTFNVEPITYNDIVSVWSGLRPLLGQEGKKPSEISRRDEAFDGPGGLVSIAGGKLTSYRSMAERLVDSCEKKLGQKHVPSKTAERKLPGADFPGSFDELQARVEKLGFEPEEARRVAQLYGGQALDIFTGAKGPAVEAAHAVLHEGALTLEDYWVRRSARARFDDEGGLAALEPAAKAMAALLGWSEQETIRQIESCREKREFEMRAVGK